MLVAESLQAAVSNPPCEASGVFDRLGLLIQISATAAVDHDPFGNGETSRRTKSGKGRKVIGNFQYDLGVAFLLY